MSNAKHYIPVRPFLSTALRGGNSSCKSVRPQSRATSSASVVACSIWLTPPHSFDVRVSKTMAVWLQH